jgi:hypothetical protein
VRQTFRSCLLLILVSLSSSGWSQENPQFSVFVYNDAQVSRGLLKKAEQEAARVFARARLKVFWTNCSGGERPTLDSANCDHQEPTQISVRIIQHSRDLTNATFGLAYLSAAGPSRYCDVFYSRVQDLQQQGGASASSVLGHVLAHEIGHLLLGTNSHSATGIMRAQWYAEELRAAGMGDLLFSPEQGQRIREQVRSFLGAGRETALMVRGGN